MQEPQHSFIALFTLARREALLGAQGDQVIELMYGLSKGLPLLAELVGEAMCLSDERIRQILRKSVLIMHCLGNRQITLGERDGANARLLLYLDEHLRPEEAGALERMLDFAGRELAHLPLFTHALPLLVYLLYGRGETVRRTLVQLAGPGAQKVQRRAGVGMSAGKRPLRSASTWAILMQGTSTLCAQELAMGPPCLLTAFLQGPIVKQTLMYGAQAHRHQ